jgi:hypothetical protein
MEAIRPRLRALRAALFAALCVTLSSTSHVLLARTALPLTAVAAAFAAVFAVAYVMAGRGERGFWSIAGLLVPLELAIDTVFTSGRQTCYGPSGGPVTGSWRSLHETVFCHGQVGAGAGSGMAGRLSQVSGGAGLTTQVPSATVPWLLLATHIAVGLLAAWWLRRGEAALHRVARAVVAAAFRPLLLAVAAGRTGHGPRGAAWTVRPPAAPAGPVPLLLQHSVVRRGPPVLAA